MSKGRIGLKFSVNSFPIKSDFDIRINVREDLNFLRYGSSFGLTNVGVSYLDSEPINVNDNIIINDLTSIVPENSPVAYSEEIYSSQDFDLPNAKFLITDVFKINSDKETVPLYLAHDLSLYSSISDIEVLDGNFEKINEDLYSYIDESGTLGTERRSLYTNLSSSFDSAQQSYTVYYIRFKNVVTNEFITNLLNAKPFYEKTSFSTTAKTRAYTVTPLLGSAEINVHFDSKTYSPTPIPNSQRFSVQTKGDNRISVGRPSDLPPSEKWYLRINPGEFYKNTSMGDARYSVPEYEEQLFSPVVPYKLLIEKRIRAVSPRLLYVEPKPIANLETDGFYLYIVIKDKFGNTKRALTNDPGASIYSTPDGVITDVFFEKETIESVSENDGFIRLLTDIDQDSEISITYRYIEREYTYRGISVNSTINPSILNNRIVVYVKPEMEESISKTVFHLLVDEADLILQANEDENLITWTSIAEGGTLNSLIDSTFSSSDVYTGFELEILSGINAGRKIKISGYNTIEKELGLEIDLLEPITLGTKYRINKKINSYSYRDELSGQLFEYDGWIEQRTISPYYNIVLADVFAIQTLAPKNIAVSDIRVRGGGLREDAIESSLKLQDEVQWYWDVGYWDGQPYPGMGAMLVELPRNILKEVGGNFSRGQVQSIVERHAGHGTYPIIKYYDRSTEILSVQPKNKMISLTWKNVDASSYNIYLGLSPDQLDLYQGVAGVITSLDIQGLENDKVYYMMVESLIGGVKQLPSRAAFAIPFNPATVMSAAIYGETKYAEGVYSRG